jgi:zinc protease
LYTALVVDQHIAVSAGAWYDSSAIDMSKFGVYGSPGPGVTLPQVEAAADTVIAQVVEKGVTPEELARSKTKMIADAVYTHDSQASMARWYGASLTTGATVADVRHWPDRIRAVTAEEVQQAARQWLDKRRSVTGFLIKDASPQVEKRS